VTPKHHIPLTLSSDFWGRTARGASLTLFSIRFLISHLPHKNENTLPFYALRTNGHGVLTEVSTSLISSTPSATLANARIGTCYCLVGVMDLRDDQISADTGALVAALVLVVAPVAHLGWWLMEDGEVFCGVGGV